MRKKRRRVSIVVGFLMAFGLSLVRPAETEGQGALISELISLHATLDFFDFDRAEGLRGGGRTSGERANEELWSATQVGRDGTDTSTTSVRQGSVTQAAASSACQRFLSNR